MKEPSSCQINENEIVAVNGSNSLGQSENGSPPHSGCRRKNSVRQCKNKMMRMLRHHLSGICVIGPEKMLKHLAKVWNFQLGSRPLSADYRIVDPIVWLAEVPQGQSEHGSPPRSGWHFLIVRRGKEMSAKKNYCPQNQASNRSVPDLLVHKNSSKKQSQRLKWDESAQSCWPENVAQDHRSPE